MKTIPCAAMLAAVLSAVTAGAVADDLKIAPGMKSPSGIPASGAPDGDLKPPANMPAAGPLSHTLKLACPMSSTAMRIQIFDPPPGWSSTEMGNGGMKLTGAWVSDVNGQQRIACSFTHQNGVILSLFVLVPLDSCVILSDRKSFACKEGTPLPPDATSMKK